jgi:hypothetical protein
MQLKNPLAPSQPQFSTPGHVVVFTTPLSQYVACVASAQHPTSLSMPAHVALGAPAAEGPPPIPVPPAPIDVPGHAAGASAGGASGLITQK